MWSTYVVFLDIFFEQCAREDVEQKPGKGIAENDLNPAKQGDWHEECCPLHLSKPTHTLSRPEFLAPDALFASP